MVRLIKIALLILGSAILQTSLVARISILGSRLDLPLALVVAAALLRGSFYGGVVGFTTGLICDLFSGGPLGIQAFSRLVIGYSVGLTRGRLYSENFITQLIAGFGATLIAKAITSVHLSLLFGFGFLHFRFSGLILVAIGNSVLTVAVFWILKKFVKTGDDRSLG